MNDFLGFISSIFIAVFPGFGPDTPPVYAGYIEADYVYVAPTTLARIVEIQVDEKESVAAGDVLFVLDDAQMKAALMAAQSRVKALQETLQNIGTGAREEELAVVRAELESALANQSLAQTSLARDLQLLQNGIVTTVKIDQDKTDVARANAQVAQLNARLASMELPARSGEILAAEANVAAAMAEVDIARIRLEAQTLRAPVSGRVETLFYTVGEVPGAAAPVVSILPEGALNIVFYIPESSLSGLPMGSRFEVSCDGCAAGLSARLSKVATQPEFTPPTIYSRAERARMVFRAEALLSTGTRLNPGQPVSLVALP